MENQSHFLTLPGIVATFVILALWPQFAVGSGTEFMADILVFAIMAVGLYVQIGLLGMVNFGFSTFFGIGGYVGALYMMRISPALIPSLAITVACVSIVALALGILVRRATGTAFMMITLTFSQLFYVLAVADDKWTNGINGLTGVPRPALPGWAKQWGMTLSSDAAFYYFCLIVFVAVVLTVWLLQKSRLGAVFAGIRQNEERMTC